MEFVIPQFQPAYPEIALLSAICVVLVADLFVPTNRRIVTWSLALLSLAVTAGFLLDGGFASTVTTFSGSYIADPLGSLLKLFAVLSMALVLIYARDYLREHALERGEFYVLALFSLLGIMVMVSAASLLTMYMGLEVLSLSLYAMVAFDRDSSVSAEAAMKYFVLGAIASGILLYGVSLVYGTLGSVQFADLAQALSRTDGNDLGFWFGLSFLVAGIAFKFGAVPFHMWIPDVYHGARTPVTLLIGTAPKIASFALAIRVLVDGLGDLHAAWQSMLIVLAVGSIALGNLVALAQTNLKRMLAYSTISHVGFILMGILAGTTAGYRAALFYTLTYVLMSAGAFAMILLLSRRGFEADNIDDFRGLNRRSPWFAAMMACFMFGLAGIPPWVGFWGKLNVISAVLNAGDGSLYLALAIIMVVFSVIGAFYYLRVLKVIYFDAPESSEQISKPIDFRWVLSANALAVLGLGCFPGLLLKLCSDVIA
ncbi:MAG: NADH-quinone oxidoreductase subunit NuoN [Pseudomonadota bacterium]